MMEFIVAWFNWFVESIIYLGGITSFIYTLICFKWSIIFTFKGLKTFIKWAKEWWFNDDDEDGGI